MAELTLELQLSKPGFDLSTSQTLPLEGITVLWGASGSGKSLLLRSIAGFEEASGFIKLDEQVLLHDESTCCVKPYLRPIGYVSQQPELFSHLTVKQNLDFGYKRRGRLADQNAYSFQEVIAALGLEKLLDKKPGTLSGGQKQRCAIAQSLLSYPKLLLMDEPLSALDTPARQTIMHYLAQIPRLFKVPMIYVTHAYEELLMLADQVIVIEGGQCEDCMAIAEYCSNYDNHLLPAEQLCTVLTGQLAEHRDFGLSELQCEGQSLYLQHSDSSSQTVKAIIYAKDVSVSLSRSEDTSILNLLDTQIENIIDYTATSKLLQLSMGQQRLLSLITCKSLASLNLQQGQKVIAQVKTVSLKA